MKMKKVTVSKKDLVRMTRGSTDFQPIMFTLKRKK